MTCSAERLSTVEDDVARDVESRLAHPVQAGRGITGGMGPASDAEGPRSVLLAGTAIPTDIVLQCLDFRSAVKTIGSDNVRATNQHGR